jgi:glycosyltransferase involved in cell wall biosynthesis
VTVNEGTTLLTTAGRCVDSLGSMARPRLLFLITLAETGGAQAYVASLLPAVAREFDVAVAAHGDGFLRDAADAAGVRYIALEHLRRPLDPLRDARALGELVRVLRAERPLILHANSSKAGILGRTAAVLTRVPIRIFTAHGWAFAAHEGVARLIYLWADRLMRRATTATVCVAESERAAGLRARTCTRDRTVVIHNGVALDGPRRAPGSRRSPAVVLSVSRLRPPKDATTLVRAIARLERGAVRLRIAGDGPDRAALVAEIERLGVGDAVELLGERSDVAELLASSDAFVLSSRSEGLPMSVLEAMAAAVPVVATAVGGVPELVRDGETGMLVAAGDDAALAAALERLVRDPELRDRLGEGGRERVEREFALDACRRAHLALYDRYRTRR